ncbi:protein C19orf12 homolog [Phymastichus coffea]|uniref:protein C19orf12 homolog n=1 Tax=Phymastichus coffea TaxID=108790 RepID=UPI00273BD3AB|nr:protein C19orf12 homolog [Phymastichus coffea]XP_058798582.1 protein C19orf12 homolog [Phymastichus coffea]XP_058798583.1 protein C19orf12 homolog [Phymastichus coffea]
MFIETKELFDVIVELSTIKEMKVALNTTVECGVVAAISTMIGGLVAGPPGIAAGGLVGTLISSCHANGKFKSVPEILMKDTTQQQKEKLANALRNFLTKENIITIVQLITASQNNPLLLQSIKKIVRDFLMTNMGYRNVS